MKIKDLIKELEKLDGEKTIGVACFGSEYDVKITDKKDVGTDDDKKEYDYYL